MVLGPRADTADGPGSHSLPSVGCRTCRYGGLNTCTKYVSDVTLKTTIIESIQRDTPRVRKMEDGILKTVQVTHRKTGKKEIKNKINRKQPKRRLKY